MLRTAIAGAFLALYTLVAGPPFILHCIVTGSPEWLYRVGVAGARFALKLAGVRILARGQENIPNRVCLFLANHTSNLDPPVVVASIPRRVGLLGKREVFKIPILGRALIHGQFIPVDRGNRAAAIASSEKLISMLRAGVSYLVFPEGTRSPDGRLREFRKGMFIAAIRAGVPVVPVAVGGTHHLMAKGSTLIRPGTVEVTFLPAIDAGQRTEDQRHALRGEVHAAIASALPEDQAPSPRAAEGNA